MSDYNQQGDRPAIDPALVGAGTEVLRDWMGRNWSEIRDGAEPEISLVVRDLLSLGRSGACHRR